MTEPFSIEIIPGYLRLRGAPPKLLLEFYNPAIADWEIKEQFQIPEGYHELDLRIRKPEPRLILDDLAPGGIQRRLASSAGAMKIKDAADVDVMNIEAHAIRHAHGAADPIPAASLTAAMMKADEIKFTVPILFSSSPAAVPADVEGVYEFARFEFIPPSSSFKHLKSAVAVIDFIWAPTADGRIQLFDSTAGVVRGESVLFTGGEASRWMTFDVTGLVEGNRLVFRALITVAGASGETATLLRGFLMLTLGVS